MLVSSGAIAAGLGAAGPGPPAARPGHPAGRGERRPGALLAGVQQAFARHGLTRRAGAADRRRRQPPRATTRNARRTLDRLLELGVVPVVNENDTVATHEIRVRRQRPARRARRPPRRADALRAALRRRRALRRAAGARRRTTGSRWCAVPPTSPACASAARAAGVGTGRHGHQGRGGRDRGRRRGSRPCSPRRRTAPEGWPATTSARGFAPHRHAARRPAAVARARRPPARPAACSTRARSPRSSTAAAPSCPPGSPRSRAASRRATRSSWRIPAGAWWRAGLVNYDAADLPRLLGRSTRELARELGPATSARSCTGTTWCVL